MHFEMRLHGTPRTKSTPIRVRVPILGSMDPISFGSHIRTAVSSALWGSLGPRAWLATTGAGQGAAVGGENERELPTLVLAPDHVLFPIACLCLVLHFACEHPAQWFLDLYLVCLLLPM